MIIKGTTDFELSEDLCTEDGVCQVCNDKCFKGCTLCHRCAIRRRDLRRKFRQIVEERMARFGGHLRPPKEDR